MAKKNRTKTLVIAFVVLVLLPAVGVAGWYGLTYLQLSGSGLSAEEAMAAELEQEKQAVRNKIISRADQEDFKVDSFDACTTIEDQYRVPTGFVFTEFTRRQLVGLNKKATDDEVQERCVIFAKVVARMQKLAHHDRYVFVCQGFAFKTDDDGKYRLLADRDGKGVIEVKAGLEKLIPIRRHSHILLGVWQVYNLGDGCLVIGMSKADTFTFSGYVELLN